MQEKLQTKEEECVEDLRGDTKGDRSEMMEGKSVRENLEGYGGARSLLLLGHGKELLF